MKEKIILILKGIIVGLGKIIPGVSGAMLAMTLGIYDKCIYAISNFTKNIKTNIYFLGCIGLGVIISIGIFSNMVIYSLDNYFFVTMCLFAGLIIGGIPKLYNKSKINVMNIKNILIIIITFMLIVAINLINPNKVIKTDPNFITLIIIGFIEAFAMIVPGISGTALLMMLGYYDLVVFRFSQIFNLMLLFDTIKFFIPFGLGMCIGIFIVSNLINFFLKKYEEKTYSVIFGLILSSIYILIMDTLNYYQSVDQILIGAIILIIGSIISYSLESIIGKE